MWKVVVESLLLMWQLCEKTRWKKDDPLIFNIFVSNYSRYNIYKPNISPQVEASKDYLW